LTHAQIQKAALSKSAAAAGIDILQFIAEPIAALLAHDAKLQAAGEANAQDKIIVVADLGSSRSDVAVVASRGGIYTTLATVHDYELGGKNLDDVLIEYAAKEYLKKNKSAKDPRKDERGLAKLTADAESVKKALSIGASAQFAIESLTDGIDFNLTVNRTRFELLGNKIFASIVRLLESAVSRANLDPLDIDEILLSGGSSHVPKIAASVSSAFPETTTVISPSTSASAVNPSELTVRGAAMQASLIAEFEKEQVAASTEAVVTVTPQLTQAIGLALDGGEGSSSFAIIVEPNTPVPVRRTAQLTVAAGGDVLLRIAEGKREIKVTKQEPAPKAADDDEEDDDDDDDEDDEPEEVREKVWKTGNVLAELAIRDVKPKGKVEVQINVAADLTITIVAREVGGKGGVRGVVEGKA
jgi:molecular chaperone DnaK (HSP70)